MTVKANTSLDPADFEIKLVTGVRAKRRQRHVGDFVMVPMMWVDRLAQSNHHGTIKLALHLLHKAWREKNYDVLKLSNVDAARVGVPARSKWRSLRELERLELVVVTSRSRRAPTIRLLKVPKT
jgi:hypothetical protein